MLADHGHTYTKATRIPLEDYLQQKSWHVTDKLKNPDDVAYIRFGLETYASFCTQQPAKLAADLVRAQGVQVVSYARDNEVVVLTCDDKDPIVQKGGHATYEIELRAWGGQDPGVEMAIISRKNGRYSYRPGIGDPLQLKPILAGLKADAEGFYDADELFAKTTTHIYPAPLERLWRAHFGLVQDSPDVIISLEDNYYSGAKGFADAVDIASTHGGLDAKNSTTFVMSTVGPLPRVMRSAEVPVNMKKLTGADFPMRK
jgi:hypothetical protein